MTVNTIHGQNVIDTTIFVNGDCDMCKVRIEKICDINGIRKAEWDTEKKLLHLKLRTSKVSLLELEQLIADGGYDTQDIRATDAAYEALPDCCQYQRKKQD